MYIQIVIIKYTKLEIVMKTTTKMTSIRLDIELADKAARVMGVRSRSEAVHIALREMVALATFKNTMLKHGGKLKFAGHGK
jgi:Arc/MetJ family transcription regulator